jgi:hypothetical protein
MDRGKSTVAIPERDLPLVAPRGASFDPMDRYFFTPTQTPSPIGMMTACKLGMLGM